MHRLNGLPGGFDEFICPDQSMGTTGRRDMQEGIPMSIHFTTQHDPAPALRRVGWRDRAGSAGTAMSGAAAIAGRPILILEDDPEVALTISGSLERDGWLTRHAATLSEGFAALKEHNPCIAIVDLSLPDGSGMNLVREASSRIRTGIIVISGRGDEVDRVVGLEVGADDYISKPFSPREMTARVRALYRRLGGDNPLESAQVSRNTQSMAQPAPEKRAVLRVDDITLDPGQMRIIGPHGITVNLTGGEADLLGLLINAGDEPLAREAVAEHVLGHKLLPQQRGIDQLASNLRRKLESLPGSTMRISAVRGKGYRLIY